MMTLEEFLELAKLCKLNPDVILTDDDTQQIMPLARRYVG